MARTSIPLRIALLTALLVAACALGFAASTSGAVASASPCEPGDTELIAGYGGAGLGHWDVPFLLVDPGARHCTFKGYPRVRLFVNSTKRWVVARRTPSGYLGGLQFGQQVHRIDLNVDSVASFLLEGTDNPVGNATSCPSFVRIEVALPGWPTSANLPFDASACTVPEVHPLVAGPTGDQPPT